MFLVEICGSLEINDPELMAQLMRRWLNRDFPLKNKQNGWEVYYEEDLDEGYEWFYCSEGLGSGYLLQGRMRATLNEAQERLLRLADSCGQRQLGYRLDYQQVDADGKTISEEFSIES